MANGVQVQDLVCDAGGIDVDPLGPVEAAARAYAADMAGVPRFSGGLAEADEGHIMLAQRGEADVGLRVVRLGLDGEFVRAVLAEPLDVLGQVRRDVGQVLGEEGPDSWALWPRTNIPTAPVDRTVVPGFVTKGELIAVMGVLAVCQRLRPGRQFTALCTRFKAAE